MRYLRELGIGDLDDSQQTLHYLLVGLAANQTITSAEKTQIICDYGALSGRLHQVLQELTVLKTQATDREQTIGVLRGLLDISHREISELRDQRQGLVLPAPVNGLAPPPRSHPTHRAEEGARLREGASAGSGRLVAAYSTHARLRAPVSPPPTPASDEDRRATSANGETSTATSDDSSASSMVVEGSDSRSSSDDTSDSSIYSPERRDTRRRHHGSPIAHFRRTRRVPVYTSSEEGEDMDESASESDGDDSYAEELDEELRRAGAPPRFYPGRGRRL